MHTCELFGFNLEIHTANTPLLDVANLHVACTARNTTMLEVHHPVFRFGLKQHPFDVGRDGCVHLPRGAGTRRRAGLRLDRKSHRRPALDRRGSLNDFHERHDPQNPPRAHRRRASADDSCRGKFPSRFPARARLRQGHGHAADVPRDDEPESAGRLVLQMCERRAREGRRARRELADLRQPYAAHGAGS